MWRDVRMMLEGLESSEEDSGKRTFCTPLFSCCCD